MNVISLDELTPKDVFTRRLKIEELEDEEFISKLDLSFRKSCREGKCFMKILKLKALNINSLKGEV